MAINHRRDGAAKLVVVLALLKLARERVKDDVELTGAIDVTIVAVHGKIEKATNERS